MNTVNDEKPHTRADDSANALQDVDSLSNLLIEIAKTKGFNRILGNLLPELVKQWAGKNPLKKILARIVEGSIRKGFIKKKKGADELVAILREKDFIGTMGRELPGILNGALDIIHALILGIEALSADEKILFVDNLFSSIGRGRTGEIVTSLAKTANDIHEKHPRYFSEKIERPFHQWVKNTDFGEIKEFFDRSEDDLISLVGTINQVIWQYPAKMICVLSVIPNLFNIITRSLKEVAAPMNNMAPDLLTDVLLSLIQEVKAEPVGELINELSELIRKIHTGSALIGDMGKPQFPFEISQKAGEVLNTIDINLLLKARALLSEIKELTLLAFIDLLQENPALAKEFFQSHLKKLAGFVRTWSHKVDAFEKLFTDEEIAREFTTGMREIDAQELAETINRFCTLLNQVRVITPDIIRTTLTETINSVDPHEVGETARWFTNDVVRSFKPIAPEVLPPVIRGVAELLSTDQYDNAEDLKDALGSLRKVLTGKEASV